MAEPAGHLEEDDFQPGIRLLARLARVAEQACQATGISLPQYRLLVSISGQPQRVSELAARVGVSRPTLAPWWMASRRPGCCSAFRCRTTGVASSSW